MQANKGDRLRVHGRTVGHGDRLAEVEEVLGEAGEPPYRVRYDDGHEAIVAPGPDSVVEHETEQRRTR
ncbi:protein of unknown function [Actinacidiphila yanglinensis]|uniref:DUF1918 domain-containing protein n=1 Tax=Actinacidiphila yanglinensis TaxID=310779 RepID=A0A1H6D9K2_9ACTN|nr:DUF1918 domain-containing protein [Actinacidiphila yanglinensis]SEG81186.1 protein of unknown function [Actinacidiphila yanglinensis]